MATKGVPLWSKTAANNATADSAGGVNYAEGQSPPTLNDSARAAMASVAGWRDDLYGLTTAGTSTAYTVTTNSTFAAAADMSGAVFTIIPHTTCGASPTLAVDGLTARALNSLPSTAVASGVLVAGTPYIVKYVHASTEFIVIGIAERADPNCFATVAVSGQSNVVADSSTDTLTLAAGSGISITTDASTDTVTVASRLAAGSGISLTTDASTGTVTIANSSNAFSTIAVSGQSNVEADSLSDTLTLVAGTNVTLTTSAGGDSVTIAAAGGGGSASDSFKTISVSGQSDVVADSSTDTLTLVAGTGMTITTDAATDTITLTGTGGDVTLTGTQTLTNKTLTNPAIIGTTTNDSAAAGNVGQLLETATGSTSLTTATAANVISVSLTAGDWDVWGTVAYATDTSTTMTSAIGYCTTGSASVPSLPNGGSYFKWIGSITSVANNIVMPTGTRRISISATTTVYLGTVAVFTGGSCSASGYIGARRVR